MSSTEEVVHATCVLIGEGAILIRGPSGAGKSSLALALMDAAGPSLPARLVGDDRIRLRARHGRLIARGEPAIACRIEARGIGVLPALGEAAAVVRLVVDLAGQPHQRLPDPDESVIELCGLRLPRLAAPEECGAGVILRRYRVLDDTLMTE
jgi:HPr kinase/phosphorylase